MSKIASPRAIVVALFALLVLAPAARAATASTDSPRDPGLPASQDFSHIDSTIDPVTGTWSVAYTFYGPPSADAWGNLGARLFVGASQCADFQASIAGFQQAPTLPGDNDASGSVTPPPDRVLRAAQSVTKTVAGNTITLTMVDTSLIGAAPTCVDGQISHKRFLDEFGPLPFPDAPPVQPVPPEPGTPAPPPPPPKLAVAAKSTHLTATGKGVVKVSLKPFNQDAAGAVTLRAGGKAIARASYRAKAGKAVTVSLKLAARSLRSLKRHRSLSVTLTATAQAGTQVVTKAVRARVRVS
ncbi:hypothetical protein OM076_11195 [Solirubrobacter ginsenosidimutans]|uniref:Uncharacterized protein n=1 Tax=Solirubrobacter ginsenosidimutans TaxID=490573 RepID=A0A9X3S243_9ACTN|nr:hypothetical protein [Solirubrobacter ginsenosidimutans]MDA0160831.1 hypothetical protein [Solirubrobacter ginsenosidimutans]